MSTQTRAHRRQHQGDDALRLGAGDEGDADTHGAVRTDLRYACITYVRGTKITAVICAVRGTKITAQSEPARHGEKVGDDKVALSVIALRLVQIHPDATLKRVSDWLCARETMSHTGTDGSLRRS
jgi:hypothetical protein